MLNDFFWRVGPACKDLIAGFQRYELWMVLAWRDVLSRYRRSRLGPFWIPLSMLIVAPTLGMLYGGLMNKPVDTYIPYILVGFTVWALLQSSIVDGCQVFTSATAAIKEVPCQYSIFVYRVLCRNLLIFMHNIVAYVIIIAIFELNPFPNIFYVIPGLFLVVLNSAWVALLFGLINARSRDFAQFIANVMRLSFFATPIIWYANDISGVRSLIVDLNPFYYFVTVIREPLLGSVPEFNVWMVVLSITILGWILALSFFSYSKEKLAFWL